MESSSRRGAILSGAVAAMAVGAMASSMGAATVGTTGHRMPFESVVDLSRTAKRSRKKRNAGVRFPSFDPLPPRALQVPFANRPKVDPVERNRAAAKRARKARRVTRHSR